MQRRNEQENYLLINQHGEIRLKFKTTGSSKVYIRSMQILTHKSPNPYYKGFNHGVRSGLPLLF